MPCNNCEEELITTSQGPQGEQGIQGLPGTNGTNGVLDWNEFNLSCWITEGIISNTEDNEVITQDFINTVCEMYQRVNANPVAVNDYRTIDQGTTAYIQVIDNDIYYPDVTVTIAIAPSNGTATVEPDNKTIKYIPDSTFVGGEDFDYTINDGLNTSTATIKVTVKAVISQQTIQDTVLEQLQVLLQSDDYWDLGFQLGDSIIISNINLEAFDFTNPFTAGKGKSNARYKKWAIKNGNNGTEDFTEGTFRGFNSTNSDYDESAKSGGSDALSITLTKANIPPHRHTVDVPILDDSFLGGYNPDGGGDTSIGAVINNDMVSTTLPLSKDVYRFKQNSGDGSDNINSQDELPTIQAITEDIRNYFKTVIVIQKIIA